MIGVIIMLLEWTGWAGTGTAVMNAIIIAFLIAGLIVGFMRGFVETSVGFLEFLLVAFLAFILKNPISVFLYTKLPFFDFDIRFYNFHKNDKVYLNFQHKIHQHRLYQLNCVE